MAEPYAQVVARLMRETADLIERGIIQDIQINVEYGHEVRPDPKTHGFTMRHFSTGERIVTITLRGNDFQRADWTQAQPERPSIGRDPKLPR